MVERYIFSGSLPEEATTYVTREADTQLYEGLKAGKFCYVLNSRQTGKSSLRVRTMRRLREEGFSCVSIDLSFGGIQYVTPEQWYVDLLDTSIDCLALDVDLEEWWLEHKLLSPLKRFGKLIEEVLLVEVRENLVVEESDRERPRSVEEIVRARIIVNWESQDEPEHLVVLILILTKGSSS